MPKILTQCHTTDFKQAVEFSLSIKEGDPTPRVTRKQGTALLVVAVLIKAGLTFEEIYTIRELLIWDNGRWIWKFYRTQESMKVRTKLSQPGTQKLIQEKLNQIGTKLEEE